MRRTLWLTCGVLGGMIGLTVFAQNDGELAPEPSSDEAAVDAPAPTPADTDSGKKRFDGWRFVFPQHPTAFASPPAPAALNDEPEDVPGSVEESVVEQVDELRQQYRQLIEEKSILMDRSTLHQAISSTERDIDELKANAQLEHAKQYLLELVKSHPQTEAAQTARAMLQASQGRQPNTSSAPYYSPGPTPSEDAFAPSPSPAETYEREREDHPFSNEVIRKRK